MSLAYVQDVFKKWATKFSEAWTACMLCMVQGDLTVVSLNHAITASKTGALAGLAFVITSSFAAINNKWANAWLTGAKVLTMCADVIVHPTHFGYWWTEAACTGLGAAFLCYILENKHGKSVTEKQQRFLEVLFDEAGGDVVAAKKLAGYGDNSSTAAIVEALKDEIADKTRTYFARTAPRLLWLWLALYMILLN